MESEDLASVESLDASGIDSDVSGSMLLLRDDVLESWGYRSVDEDAALAIRNCSGVFLLFEGVGVVLGRMLPVLVVLLSLWRDMASSWTSRSSLA